MSRPALAVDAARHALGEQTPWLRLESLPAHPGTHTIASLTNDDGAGIDAQLARWRASEPGFPDKAAVSILRGTALILLTPLVAAIARDRTQITVDLTQVHFSFGDGDDDGNWFGDGIWSGDQHRASWPAGQVHPVEDPVPAYRALVATTVGALEPLVRAAGDRIPIAQRGLWRYVMEPFSVIAPQASMTDPTLAHAECEAFEAGARGSRLGQRLRFVEFDCDGHPRSQVRRPACCYAHAWPIPPEDKAARPWDHHCSDCPLIPAAESIRLLRREYGADR